MHNSVPTAKSIYILFQEREVYEMDAKNDKKVSLWGKIK